MSEKVIITRSKLDDLANVIGGKTDVGVPLTLNQMTSEVGKLTHKPLLLSLSNISTGAPVQGAYTPTSIDTTDYITTDTMYYIIVEGTTTCTRTSTVDSFYYEGPFTTPSNTTDVVTIPLSTVQVISGSGSAHSQSIRLGVSKVNIFYVNDQGASTCTSNLSISYYPVKNITINEYYDVKNYYAANVNVQGKAGELVVTPGASEQVFSIYDETEDNVLVSTSSNFTNNQWETVGKFSNVFNGTTISVSGTFTAKIGSTTIDTETIDTTCIFHDEQCSVITEKFIIRFQSPNLVKLRYIGSQNCTIISTSGFRIVAHNIYDYYNPVTVNPMEDILEKFIKRDSSITSFYNSNYSIIKPYAFASIPYLSYAEFPNCSIIGSYAFYSCSRLASVSILNCTNIDTGAFYNCYSLTSINLPNCTIIGNNCFYSNAKLSFISLPNCLSIGGYTFYYCSSLITLNLSKCEYIDGYVFYGCNTFTSISLPKCSILGTQAFYSCKSLTSIYLPELTYLSMGVFSSCINLSTASFPKCSYISGSCFIKCYNLLSLYLMSTSVVKLSQSNAFNSTPISNYTTSTNGVYGSIYVPSSLLTQYQSATNWTYFSSRFVGI